MIIGYARVSTTEQNLGLRHDDLKPAFEASVDPTAFCFPSFHGPGRFRGRGKGSSSGTSDRYVR
jgi:hypothetical protein